MERKTNEFRARSDDGQEYLIYEYTNFIDVGTLDKPNEFIKGLKRLCLNGEDVNFIEEGVYEIVSSGTIVRRIH
jgi:hypothetical protein